VPNFEIANCFFGFCLLRYIGVCRGGGGVKEVRFRSKVQCELRNTVFSPYSIVFTGFHSWTIPFLGQFKAGEHLYFAILVVLDLPPLPAIANIDKASICHTERRKTKWEKGKETGELVGAGRGWASFKERRQQKLWSYLLTASEIYTASHKYRTAATKFLQKRICVFFHWEILANLCRNISWVIYFVETDNLLIIRGGFHYSKRREC
jgi:hypothetical protein